MNNFYINIDNTYSTTGSGISSNPFNYAQFKTHIASGLVADTTYFIEGVRTLEFDESADFDVNVIVSTISVTLTNRLKEPWYITTYQGPSSQNKISFNTGNVVTSSSFMTPLNLIFQNAVFALSCTDDIIDQIKFNNIDGRNDTSLNLDNVFIEAIQ
jgi:hypothetical protein